MVKRRKIPDRGDIIVIDFEPQAGKEIMKRRPALVLSPAEYNAVSSLVICCPITSKIKGKIIEIPLPDEIQTSGVVLADQIKSLDWRMRNAKVTDSVDDETVEQVLAILLPLLGVCSVYGP